jgi:CMP-N,N'-diacetyllegionaminic acid synthase
VKRSVFLSVLAIIPARAGSRGVPGKNTKELLGKPVIAYTIEAAQSAKKIDRIVVTTDDEQAMKVARKYNISIIERPAELAGDTARIDDVMRHCCKEIIIEGERNKPDYVVLLYANVPVRAEGVIDEAIERLMSSDADSIQTMTDVGKFHPDWLYQLDGDRASKYTDNRIYRRQDLNPLYCIDGAVGAVKYEVLMGACGSEDPHAFWGNDRRALLQEPHETIDIDTYRDLLVAEAALREKQEKTMTA